jgi:hypothetical protein
MLAFNILILGTLYGLGKTHMIFLQTLVANVFYIVYYDLVHQVSNNSDNLLYKKYLQSRGLSNWGFCGLFHLWIKYLIYKYETVISKVSFETSIE